MPPQIGRHPLQPALSAKFQKRHCLKSQPQHLPPLWDHTLLIRFCKIHIPQQHNPSGTPKRRYNTPLLHNCAYHPSIPNNKAALLPAACLGKQRTFIQFPLWNKHCLHSLFNISNSLLYSHSRNNSAAHQPRSSKNLHYLLICIRANSLYCKGIQINYFQRIFSFILVFVSLHA